MKTCSKKNLLTAIMVAGWLIAVGCGMERLVAYSFTPGAVGASFQNWPSTSALARNPHGYSLVVALHPECPCSQATIEELDGILTCDAGRLQVRVLFVDLPGLPEPPEKTALWHQAVGLAGVSVLRDAAGAEAHRFGMLTSGEARLYSPEGNLLFHGGITGERGHAGANPGQDAVLTLLATGLAPPLPVTTPVFGCALWNDPAPTAP